MKRSITAILLTAFTLLASVAYGQTTEGSDNINATTSVVSQITVTGETALDFGNITAGGSSTVAPDDGTAGNFQVQGTASQEVILTLSLPSETGSSGYTYALDSGDTGGTAEDQYLELTFGAGDGDWIEGQDVAAAGTNLFNPTSQETATLGGSGYLEVYVGGTADASAGQPDGTYTGSITLTVDYN